MFSCITHISRIAQSYFLVASFISIVFSYCFFTYYLIIYHGCRLKIRVKCNTVHRMQRLWWAWPYFNVRINHKILGGKSNGYANSSESRLTCSSNVNAFAFQCKQVSQNHTVRQPPNNLWCLQRLLGVKWYQFVSNAEVRQTSGQPLLTSTIQARHLSLFVHIAWLHSHQKIGINRLVARPWITWMKTVRNDIKSHNLTLTEAVNNQYGSESPPGPGPFGDCWLRVVKCTYSGPSQKWYMCTLWPMLLKF